jgi:Ca-activated chloride channel family protein
MIRLADPVFLALLALLPLLAWTALTPRLRAALHYSRGETLRALPPTWATRLHALPLALRLFGLALLIVALARPQRALEESRVETETVDIVLVVDTSTSMEAIDMSTGSQTQNRLQASLAVMDQFIRKRAGDRIGLIAFAALPYTVSPLTLDHGWLLQRLDTVQTRMMNEDGTGIGVALASAVNRLRESEAETKIIVLLTDGMNNAGDITPLNAARLAESLGIRVYTVGAGSDGPVRIPQTDLFGRTGYAQTRIPIDETTLKRIAELTKARYFRAQNFEELKAVYEEIDGLERTKVEVEEYTRYEERFLPLAIAGLVLLCLDRILGAGRLGRVLA